MNAIEREVARIEQAVEATDPGARKQQLLEQAQRLQHFVETNGEYIEQRRRQAFGPLPAYVTNRKGVEQ
jgi:hypothetical protein